MNESEKQAFQEQKARGYYFFTHIQPRFSDLIQGQRLHVSKCYEFFEMARFDVLERFRQSEWASISKESLNGLLFLVARTQYTQHRQWVGERPIRIKTRLLVQRLAVLEFEQELLDETSSEPYASATVKVAAVKQDLQRVTDWEDTFAPVMSMFVVQNGIKDERV